MNQSSDFGDGKPLYSNGGYRDWKYPIQNQALLKTHEFELQSISRVNSILRI